MGEVIPLHNCSDVNKIYKASDTQLLEMIYPFNHSLDSRHAWFAIVARQNNTTSSKIKHIFYGNSKLTSIERIYFEDKARQKTHTSNHNQMSFHLRGRGHEI